MVKQLQDLLLNKDGSKEKSKDKLPAEKISHKSKVSLLESAEISKTKRQFLRKEK